MAYFGKIPPKPDGTEGYASITLTLKEPDDRIETIACFIKNDEQLQELQFLNESEKYVKTHEDQKTNFFLYFYCSEVNLSNRLVKSEIVAHRFTKPTKDKNCIIDNKLETQPFFLRDNHVFLPACHKDLKTVDFENFLSAHSSAVTKKNLSAGEYRGVQNSNVPDRVKYYSLSVSSSNNTLHMTNLPKYKVFQNLVDGPLLLFEEASWRLIGWYKKAPEGDRITVSHLGGAQEIDTTDILKTYISNQTVGSQPPSDPSGSADQPTRTDQSDQSELTDQPTSTDPANQSGLTGPPTSTDQASQSGLTGPPTSTDQASQSGCAIQPTSTDINQSHQSGPPTSPNFQPNPPGSTGLPTSTNAQPSLPGSTGLPTSTNSQDAATHLVLEATTGAKQAIKFLITIDGFDDDVAARILDQYKGRFQHLLVDMEEKMFPKREISITRIYYKCIIIELRVKTIEALEELWERYKNGDLKKALERILITDEIRKLGKTIEMVVTMSEEQYLDARNILGKQTQHKEKDNPVGEDEPIKELEDESKRKKSAPGTKFEKEGMAAAANVFFIQDIPHGYVKRVMWFKYLQAFIAKTQQSPFIDQTIICDVFAGTGRYNKEWSPCYTDYGSPLVALGAAIRYFIWKRTLPSTFEPIPDANPNLVEDDSLMLKEYKIVFNFVEKVTENCKSLIKNIILFFNFHGIGVSKTQQLSNQVCVSSIDESVSIQCKIFNCEFTEFPAPNVPDNARMATFIDPFEFKMIPSQHVSQFVGKHKELSINLMTSSMNRFFTMGMDPELLLTLKETAEQSDFVDALANLYAEKLEINDPENRNHVLTFEMRDKRNVRLYHLVFATSHIEGLKSMKESLNRGTQEQHTFSLSDYKILRKNIPLNLGNQQDPNAVADVIFNEFKGRLSVSIKDIEMFVWLDTPYVHRKKPLAILEKAGKIVDVVPQRLRRFTFPDSTEWLISFASE